MPMHRPHYEITRNASWTSLFILATTLLMLRAAWAFGPHVPSPHEVMSAAQRTAERAKAAERRLVNDSWNVKLMDENVTRVDALLHDNGKVWTDAIQHSVEKGLKKAEGLAYLHHIAHKSALDTEIFNTTRDVATVGRALETAQAKLAAAGPGTWQAYQWSDRIAYLSVQLADMLPGLTDLLGKLDPLHQIEVSLRASAPHAEVTFQSPWSGSAQQITSTIRAALREEGPPPDEITKAYVQELIARAGNAVPPPRLIEHAEYNAADGSATRDVTGIVNDLIRKNQGLFIKIAPHPNAGNANDLFGDTKSGANKVFYVRDRNGEEYYWSENQEVRFLVPAEKVWTEDITPAGPDWGDYKFVTASDDDHLWAVQKDGLLRHWHYSDGRLTEMPQHGSGWQHFTHVFAGPDNVLFAVKKNGDLIWYQSTPDNTWAPKSGSAVVGTGFNEFDRLFHVGDGVFYALRPNGDLHWYKHLGGPRQSYASGSGALVGTGWKYEHVFGGPGGLIFAVKADGSVLRYKRPPDSSGANTWTVTGDRIATGWSGYEHIFNSNTLNAYAIDKHGTLHVHRRYSRNYWAQTGAKIGSGWSGFRSVSAGDDDNIYAVNSDGKLLHYRHGGGPNENWVISSQEIGSGWDTYNHVFAGADGVIFGIKPEGTLHWYKSTGEGQWANGSGNQIGSGWEEFFHPNSMGGRFFVFHGGDNVIYGITPAGELLWYQHMGGPNTNWAKGSGTQVGAGWNEFIHAFGAPGGLIFGVTGGGSLVRYKREDGPTGAWQPGSEHRVGTGWAEFNTVFASNNREVFAITGGGSLMRYLRARD